MNILNKINYQDLVSNSNPEKSLHFKSRMVQELTREFSTEEQKWFVANLYMYLHYHPTEDYPIDLEDAWKIIGFKNKGNAKKKLESNFILDEDYLVLLVQLQKQKNQENRGGHNKEQIMLNMDTFKNLCMIANTPEGKQNRKYYIKLENVNNKIINEDYLDYQKQLEEKEIELQDVKSKNQLLSKKRFYGTERGDTVYIYVDRDLLKVGKSDFMQQRESGLHTGNFYGNVEYAKKCYNSTLLEKMCHHILDKYRDTRDREWFSCSFEMAKNVLDTTQLFLDGGLSCITELYENDTFNIIQESLNCVVEELPDNKPIYKDLYTRRKEEKMERDFLEKEQFPNELCVQNKPTDFEQFAKDKFEIGKDYKVLKQEVVYCYKLWSNNFQNEMLKALGKFLEKGYTISKDYYPEEKSKLLTVHGIRLKQIEFKIKDKNNPTEIEQFVLDKCKIGYGFRIASKILYKEFENYKRKTIDDYSLDKTTKSILYNKFKDNFFSSTVFTGAKETLSNSGFLGVTLKTDNENVGFRLNSKRRKSVVKIDIETDEIVDNWDSLMEASLSIGLSPSVISTRIKHVKVMDNKYILKYI
jgi:phage anti-repressor protein